MNGKQRVFIEEYLQCWNASEAARRAGYSEKTAGSIGDENLKKPEIAAAIKARIAEKAMSADEVLIRLAEHGRGDIGQFFKVIERWTPDPLPSHEVIRSEKRENDKGETEYYYLVRYVALDMDSLKDSRLSRLVHKFSDSPKNGLTIELYDAQAALVQLGKAQGVFSANDTAPQDVVNWTPEQWRAEQARRRQQAQDTLAAFEDDDA